MTSSLCWSCKTRTTFDKWLVRDSLHLNICIFPKQNVMLLWKEMSVMQDAPLIIIQCRWLKFIVLDKFSWSNDPLIYSDAQNEFLFLVYIYIVFCLIFTLFWLQIVTGVKELSCCLMALHRLNFFPSSISLIYIKHRGIKSFPDGYWMLHNAVKRPLLFFFFY